MRDFRKQFERFELKIRNISGSSDKEKFHDALSKASKVNLAIAERRGIIEDLYALRNVFSHQERSEYIAQVNDLAFDALKEVTELIENPPKAGVFFAPKDGVYCASVGWDVSRVMKEMQCKVYTHVPVYEENWKFRGIFSESSAFNWLMEGIGDEQFYFRNKLLKDLNKKYLYKKKNEDFDFVNADASIFDVLRKFQDALETGKRLGVIIVTKRGIWDEEPLGIATAWDIPMIHEQLRMR